MAEPPASPTSYVNGTNGTSTTSTDKVLYTDPDADTTLISTPEGRVFKVNSFWLKANSERMWTLIIDVLLPRHLAYLPPRRVSPAHPISSIPFARSLFLPTRLVRVTSVYLRKFLNSPDYHGDPITVPASTKVLKVYLDLAHTRHPHPKAVWKLREPLLKLCDEYQSPSIAERALFHSSECMDKDPWEVFCLASQRRNLGLAKAALRALADGNKHQLKITELKPEMTAGLTMPYLLGLYNAAISVKGPKVKAKGVNGYTDGVKGEAIHNGHDHDHAGDGLAGDGMTWRAIADKFTPVMG